MDVALSRRGAWILRGFFVLVVAFRPAHAEWFGYDAFPRLGLDSTFRSFAAGKSPEELALFGIPRPGHAYWTEVTVDAMAAKYPGLDVLPWRAALGRSPAED